MPKAPSLLKPTRHLGMRTYESSIPRLEAPKKTKTGRIRHFYPRVLMILLMFCQLCSNCCKRPGKNFPTNSTEFVFRLDECEMTC